MPASDMRGVGPHDEGPAAVAGAHGDNPVTATGAASEVGTDHATREGNANRPLTVHLARTGLTLTVPPHRTILQVVRAAGVDVPYACLEGKCGACEVTVLDGVPEHRDPIYANTSRVPHDCMKLCVSRARTPSLTLLL